MNILSKKRDFNTNLEKTTFLHINEIYDYDKISDEMLYNNLENYKELINQKMEICFDPSCTNLRCKNICVIYTNPKVGCTSLLSSLNLYFSEFLTVKRWHNEYPVEGRGILDMSITQFAEINSIHDKNVIMIDIYRPIFDMCLSFFFLYFFWLVPDNYQNDIDYIINNFNNFFLSIYNHVNVDYYKQVYNLNTTFNEFDFNKKHLFFRNNNIKYIKLRLIDSNEWSTILSNVFHSEFKIFTSNKTEDKDFGNIYTEFKKKYKIPKNYYELIKKNEHFLFYYTPEEQQTYLKQFDDKITDNYNGELKNIETIYPHKNNINNLSSDLKEKAIKKSNEKRTLINKANNPRFSNCICETCKIEKKEFLSKQ